MLHKVLIIITLSVFVFLLSESVHVSAKEHTMEDFESMYSETHVVESHSTYDFKNPIVKRAVEVEGQKVFSAFFATDDSLLRDDITKKHLIFIYSKEEDLNAYEVEYYIDETVSMKTLDPETGNVVDTETFDQSLMRPSVGTPCSNYIDIDFDCATQICQKYQWDPSWDFDCPSNLGFGCNALHPVLGKISVAACKFGVLIVCNAPYQERCVEGTWYPVCPE